MPPPVIAISRHLQPPIVIVGPAWEIKRPARAILDRARHRARKNGVSFALSGQDILVPKNCPVLGIPLVIGGPRSNASPSLDRINPHKGYTVGNVRVISDRANRLKGGRSLSEIKALVQSAW